MTRIANLAIVASATKFIVQEGPFSGMTILPESHRGDGDLGAKWLGLYEQELHACLADLIRRPPSAIINLGAGEGYYAIGLALAFPAASVVAFDINEAANEILRHNAAANGLTGRIAQGRSCNAEQLTEIASRSNDALLICDIDGGEVELLAAPGVVEALHQSDAVIECYDFAVKNATAKICELFYDTHDVFVISQSGRNANSYPFLERLSDNERWMLISENRPGFMHWVYCRARRSHSLSTKHCENAAPNIMSISRYLRSNSSFPVFIGKTADEHCVVYGDSIASSSTIAVDNGHGTCTLIAEGGKFETVSRFDPLIWTCAYGADEYFRCLQICLESLRDLGQYRGRDMHILGPERRRDSLLCPGPNAHEHADSPHPSQPGLDDPLRLRNALARRTRTLSLYRHRCDFRCSDRSHSWTNHAIAPSMFIGGNKILSAVRKTYWRTSRQISPFV